MSAVNSFLFPQGRYRGDVKPENLVFNANLQEFAQRVTYISGMATTGKIPIEQAFESIQELWQQLEYSKEQLGVGENPFRPGNGNPGA